MPSNNYGIEEAKRDLLTLRIIAEEWVADDTYTIEGAEVAEVADWCVREQTTYIESLTAENERLKDAVTEFCEKDFSRTPEWWAPSVMQSWQDEFRAALSDTKEER